MYKSSSYSFFGLCFKHDVGPQTAFADAAASAPRNKSQLYHYVRCEAFIENKPMLQRYPSSLISESESILMKEREEIFETLVFSPKLTHMITWEDFSAVLTLSVKCKRLCKRWLWLYVRYCVSREWIAEPMIQFKHILSMTGERLSGASLYTAPWRYTEERSYSSYNINNSSRWRWVIRFMSRPLTPM